ncbi:hypothetical protein [Streptomyces colonosanans]|uniref:Uncharacterized protein n=1 Tax=Streptomyces colonosanans TaxID=1428652 RepID=A0A1S2P9F6_9ACTN|nr:hypothetical protein [Streptomyces colonosanans]OIJ90433.1 hypothetical protein BIV24_17955 [Streptomyces colonosanans]
MGVVGEAGGPVVEAGAHRVRLGVGRFVTVVEGQQPQSGAEIGYKVRGEQPPRVDLVRRFRSRTSRRRRTELRAWSAQGVQGTSKEAEDLDQPSPMPCAK